MSESGNGFPTKLALGLIVGGVGVGFCCFCSLITYWFVTFGYYGIIGAN